MELNRFSSSSTIFLQVLHEMVGRVYEGEGGRIRGGRGVTLRGGRGVRRVGNGIL